MVKTKYSQWRPVVEFALVATFLVAAGREAAAQFSLTGTSYAQNFNGLGTTTGTVTDRNLNNLSVTLNGWSFYETGSGSNNVVTAGTGSATSGDTYNFGLSGNSDRALGGLQSGSLIPSWGFYFTNNTGSTISSLQISYVGEVWRSGTSADRIDFTYSTTNSALSNSSWTDFDLLDYSPAATATVQSGSLIASATLTGTISSLSIANGSAMFLRWADFNAPGSDAGLSIDDFSLNATLLASGGNYWAPGANGGGSGTWGSASNVWATAVGAQGTSSQATSGALIFADTAGTVTVSGSVSAAAGMHISTTGYQFTGGTIGLTGSNAAANTITTDSGVTATVASALVGSAGMTKAGAGTLTLSGNNTYSGGSTVSAGSLIGTTSSLQGAITNNAAVTFDQTSDGTYSGNMSGSGSLTKLGSGTVTLTGNNTHSGGSTISAGALQIGNGGTSGSLGGAITNNGGLIFNRSNTLTHADTISGTGSVTKLGSGTLTLSGNSSGFAGTTNVSAGMLSVTGNLGGSISVSSGAALAGTGTVGTVTVTTGATLAPGASPGVLTTGDITWAGGGNYNWQLLNATSNAGTGWDLVAGNALTITSDSTNRFNINLWSLSSINPDVSSAAQSFSFTTSGTYTIGTFASITGANGDWYSINTSATNGTGGFTGFDPAVGFFTLASTGTSIDLIYTHTPPSAYSYIGGTGNWSDTANWNPADSPEGSAEITFDGAGGTATNNLVAGTGPNELTSVTSLTFSSTAGPYTLAGNAFTLGNGGLTNDSAATQTIQNDITLGTAASLTANSGTLALSGTLDNAGFGLTVTGSGATSLGVVNGVGGLTKGGSGTATLTGPVATTSVTVNAGGLTTSGAELLADTAAVTVASNASLGLGGSETIGSLAGAGSVAIGGTSLTTGGNGSSTTFTGVISGSGGLMKQGAGTFTLGGANSYAGATIVSAGTLATSAADVLPNASAISVASGATLALGGNDTVGAFAITDGSLTGSGNTLTAATYSLGGGTVAANLGVGAATASSGSTFLNGTLGGSLTVAGGTVALGSADRLSDASVITVSSGSLGIGSFAETVGSFTITGGALGGSGTLTAATYDLDGGTVSANLGVGTLTATSGVATLSGSSEAETVNVSGGSLSLGAANRLVNTAAVTVTSGSLGMATFGDTVGTFTISGGALGGPGTLTATTYSLNGGTVTANLGSGTLTAISGATTLSGSSAAATVNVSGGALTTGAADRLANNAAVTISSGAFALGGNDTVSTYAQSGGTFGGSGTLTAVTYALTGGTVNANLGGGTLTASSGNTTLAGTLGATSITISGGTLGLSSGDQLAASANVSMTSGGLALGGNESVNTYAQSGGTLSGPGTLTANRYAISGGTLSATLGNSGTVAISSGGFIGTPGQTVANPITIWSGATASYSQNFNGLAGGLPAGWTTGTGATASSLGTSGAFTSSAVAWNNATGQFNNYASATGLTQAATSAEQSSSPDRALGVRQTGGFGDPGAAFTYAFSTTGQTVDSISLDLMQLDGQPRSTTWSIQFGSGTAPASYTTLGTWSDPGTWGTTTVTYSGTSVSGMNNLVNGVFRVVALTAAGGSGNRDSMAIDNFVIATLNAAPASVQLGISSAGSTTYSGDVSVTGAAELTAVAGGTATFSGIISGSAGSVVKTGLGTVILSGSNSYAGGTTISAGTLAIAADAALGTGNVSLGGGTLSATESFTLGSARLVTVSGTSGLDVAATKTVTFNGDFTGTGRLNKGGLGQLTLGGTSAGYTGTFAINSGIVELTNADALDNAVILQNGGTLILAPTSGTDVPLPGLEGDGGEVTIGNGRNVAVGDNSNRTYRGQIRGQGGFKKQGTGRLELTGNNDFAGATLIDTGKLVVNGSLSQTPSVTISNGAELGGSGSVAGTLQGAGAVGPGNSPGILSAPNTDPSGGLDYNFEFTSLSPDYANSSASVNDVLRLTSTTTPFVSNLGASNAVNVYLPSSLADGQTYAGGFFLDATVAQVGSFLTAIGSASFNYFVQDSAGGLIYEGLTYRTLADWNTANSRSLSVNLGTTTVGSAGFVGGTVLNGQSMQLVIVPEPSAFVLAGLGAALAGYAAWRRRTPG